MNIKTNLLLLTTLLAGTIVLVGCHRDGHDHSKHAKPAPDSGSTNKPADASPPAKPYSLNTCVVSGEKLGSMGKPVSFVHEGQEIKLCCAECRKDFDKEPAKFLAKLAK